MPSSVLLLLVVLGLCHQTPAWICWLCTLAQMVKGADSQTTKYSILPGVGQTSMFYIYFLTSVCIANMGLYALRVEHVVNTTSKYLLSDCSVGMGRFEVVAY